MSEVEEKSECEKTEIVVDKTNCLFSRIQKKEIRSK